MPKTADVTMAPSASSCNWSARPAGSPASATSPARYRIAVRFQYESHDRDGQWWRSYGNELWEFTEDGLMSRREASINDVRISESDRRVFGPRLPANHGVPFPLH